MGSAIGNYKNKLSELCHIYGVRRLGVFGSASRHDFDPKRSDIDFLVNFTEAYPLGAFEQYFGFKEALEHLFQRPVDLVEEKAIRNPYFKQAIQHDRVLVYETTSPKAPL
jgi:predicted nucleotidyltransferase